MALSTRGFFDVERDRMWNMYESDRLRISQSAYNQMTLGGLQGIGAGASGTIGTVTGGTAAFRINTIPSYEVKYDAKDRENTAIEILQSKTDAWLRGIKLNV